MARDLIRIGALAAGGDGLGRGQDGRVVFVPRTAPGDQVEVEHVEQHRQWTRARVAVIVEPGAERRDPPCPHYDVCGGCQLQHLNYEAQCQAKAGIVEDCLRRLGGFDVDPPKLVRSPKVFEYRNRVTFVLRRADGRVVAGYHGHQQPDEIVDIDRCPLAEPAINKVWAELREAWGPGAARLPGGEELRLTLRASESGSVGLVIEGGEGPGDLEALLQEIEALLAVWSLDSRGVVMQHVGVAAMSDRWGLHQLRLEADTFTQVNREAAAKLESYVLEQCGDVAGRRVIDAYCGLGVRALELAQRGGKVTGIDEDRRAITAARDAAGASDLFVRFKASSVERALLAQLPADVVILNPPRRGLSREVVKMLLRRPSTRIAYVSCDPATLARDLKALRARYDLSAYRAFDLFPQTAHVETVVTLSFKATEAGQKE